MQNMLLRVSEASKVPTSSSYGSHRRQSNSSKNFKKNGINEIISNDHLRTS